MTIHALLFTDVVDSTLLVERLVAREPSEATSVRSAMNTGKSNQPLQLKLTWRC